MGVGLVPFYEPDVPDAARYNGDGKGLANEYETLNAIAARAGLRPLSDFASEALLDAEFSDPGEGAPPDGGEMTYQAIADVLPTVQGLLHELRADAAGASELSDASYTVEELEELARSLGAAQASGSRVCLAFW